VIKFSNNRADGGAVSSPQYVDMHIPFLRAAEAYLTYAEAEFRTGSTAEALTDIHQSTSYQSWCCFTYKS
jgi:hypothetical protein